MLDEMGDLIEERKFDKLKTHKEDIMEYAAKNRYELEIPSSIFITFESEHGVEAAFLSNKKLKDIEILPNQRFGQKEYKFRPAPEASDIIWENFAYTLGQRRFRSTISIAVLCVAMMASFTLISYMANWASKEKSIYSPVDCRVLDSVYGDKL
jgi:hypothetical protein